MKKYVISLVATTVLTSSLLCANAASPKTAQPTEAIKPETQAAQPAKDAKPAQASQPAKPPEPLTPKQQACEACKTICQKAVYPIECVTKQCTACK